MEQASVTCSALILYTWLLHSFYIGEIVSLYFTWFLKGEKGQSNEILYGSRSIQNVFQYVASYQDPKWLKMVRKTQKWKFPKRDKCSGIFLLRKYLEENIVENVQGNVCSPLGYLQKKKLMCIAFCVSEWGLLGILAITAIALALLFCSKNLRRAFSDNIMHTLN